MKTIDEILREGNLDEKILIRSTYNDNHTIEEWAIIEILEEINRDRSDEWTDYDESDWIEGWIEWVEGDDFYSLLDENEQPLNDLSYWIDEVDNPLVKEKYRKYSK